MRAHTLQNGYAKRLTCLLVVLLLLGSVFSGCGTKEGSTDYSESANWAYYESDLENTKADVFFVCPTVYFGTETSFNMQLTDSKTKENFLGAVNMEKGIYDAQSRLFAPYYRQMGLNVYEMDAEQQAAYSEIAYADVKAAFLYYLEHENNGRPVILAGFSQGADMCLRLLKDCFREEEINRLLVACYAIGWRITEQELSENPHLKFAAGERDTGVIVSFNSEAEFIEDSLMIPRGTKTCAINPLNWKTDGTVADKTSNKGACFTDYDGKITKEIPNLTGAYIDTERGALKVTDVTLAEYPAGLSIFEDGIYHLYDYQFFYRNLQENVAVRLDAYLSD